MNISKRQNENGYISTALNGHQSEDEATEETTLDEPIENDTTISTNGDLHYLEDYRHDYSADENNIEDRTSSYVATFETEEKQSFLTPEEDKDCSLSRENDDKINPNDCIPPWRTCAALCMAFIFTYSAFEAIQNLQSSLNTKGHLGELSLTTMYATVQVGTILAPVGARLVGQKGILCLGFFGHLCYTCANFWPTFASLIPISAVQGVLSGGLGMAQGVYITAISTSYIYYKNLPKSKLYGIMSFFSGVFYCCFKSTQISGNLLSSVIFQSTSYNSSVLMDNKCGARVCAGFQEALEFDRPSTWLINSLFGSFALMNTIGLGIFVIGLPRLNDCKAENETFFEVVRGYTGGCLFMMINPKFVALVPFIIAESMLIMTSFSGYTKAFVSCSVGVQWVGYSMVAFGVVSSFTALIASYLAQYTGRIAQFATGMSIDLATAIIMLLWEPDYKTSPLLLLVVPMMAGVSQGILEPQLQALIGSIFSKKEYAAVYSAASAVKCMGFSIYLCMASTVCIYHALLLAVGLYIPGILGYIYIELTEWRKHKK